MKDLRKKDLLDQYAQERDAGERAREEALITAYLRYQAGDYLIGGKKMRPLSYGVVMMLEALESPVLPWVRLMMSLQAQAQSQAEFLAAKTEAVKKLPCPNEADWAELIWVLASPSEEALLALTSAFFAAVARVRRTAIPTLAELRGVETAREAIALAVLAFGLTVTEADRLAIEQHVGDLCASAQMAAFLVKNEGGSPSKN